MVIIIGHGITAKYWFIIHCHTTINEPCDDERFCCRGVSLAYGHQEKRVVYSVRCRRTITRHGFLDFNVFLDMLFSHNDIQIHSFLRQLVSRPNLPRTHRFVLFDERQIEAHDDGHLGRDSSC